MVDSGASTLFIHSRFVQENKVATRELARPIRLLNIDGTENRRGRITHVADLTMKLGEHLEKVSFTVTDIGPEDVIIGIDWLRHHNPSIDWRGGSLTFDRCPPECDHHVLTDDEKSQALDELSEQPYLARIQATFNVSTKLAAEANAQKPTLSYKEMVPPQYRQFGKVFSEEESKRLPKHKNHDHAIDLDPSVDINKLKPTRVYPLAPNELTELDNWLEDALSKGYIRKSSSPLSAPTFFVDKKDGKLRIIFDYRKLNSITIKNQYPLPLISESIDRLAGKSIFTKLDVRWGYNNIRIEEGDEWKAVFRMNRGLFEPLMMFFGLTNSPLTFQTMMNDIFQDLIREGVVCVYLDNILIFTKTIAEHHQIS